MGTRNIRVEVVSAGRSDHEIVQYALHGRPDRTPSRHGPTDKNYDDWRTEVMGLVGVDV